MTTGNLQEALSEAWNNLHNKWQHEAAEVFYQSYVVKFAQTTEDFEMLCAKLTMDSEELLKELSQIERNFEL